MRVFYKYRVYKFCLQLLFLANTAVLAYVFVTLAPHLDEKRNLKAATQQVLEQISLAKLPSDQLHSQVRDILVPAVERQELNAKKLVFIGFFMAVFGVGLPMFLFYQLNLTLRDLRRKAEKQFTNWLNWWMKNYAVQKADGKGPFYTRPDFWLNVVLFTLESYGTQAGNPFISYLGELAPIVRQEINKEKEVA